MTKKLNLQIRQGETFQRIIRWETPPFVYKSISAITRAAPASLTVPSHGLTTGWRAVVVSSNGMEEINAVNVPPRDNEYRQVTVVDPNTLTFNTVNSADYTAYVDGGYLQYYTPVDLTGYTAEMDIKDKVGGTVLFTLNTTNARIVIDSAAKTITMNVSAADTTLITWSRGVYDLEMYSPSGATTTIFSGNISVVKQVTTA
jgi:hypothetical protein